MKELLIFTNPSAATVELQHDSGLTFPGVPATDLSGRAGHSIALPEDLPEGHGAQLRVAQDGFVPVEQRGILYLRRPTRYAEFVVDDIHLQPFKYELPRLVPAGQFLMLETGERFTVIEASDFNLLARYAAGEDIEPVLRQRRDVGFNTLRVWTLFDIPGIGKLNPCPYDLLPAFCRLCARYGLYVEFTTYTSIWDPQHWSRQGDALQGVNNALVSLVNEQDRNGLLPDPGMFQPIPWLICSHGSNAADHAPVKPIWDYGEYHSNGLPQWWRKVGHNAFELSAKPMISTENTRFPDNDRSTQHAYDAAAGAALLCAGACFHSVNGKLSQLWWGDELDCAESWAQGARSVPLEFQAGQYRRRDDLLTINLLRVYQRVLPSGDSYTVRIRA